MLHRGERNGDQMGRMRTTAAVTAVALTILLVGCGGDDTPRFSSDNTPNGNAAGPSASPPPPVVPLSLAITPKVGAKRLPVSTEIGTSVKGGQVTEVKLTAEGAKSAVKGELRDDAPVGRMDGDLASQPLGPDPNACFVEGYAGLVAARFDPKDAHRQALQLTGGAANMPLFCRLSRPIFSIHHTFRGYSMPGVRIRESEHFDAALRRFKRACEKAGVLTELRRREFYEKPTQERKRKKAAAVKRHMKRNSRTPTTRRRRLY